MTGTSERTGRCGPNRPSRRDVLFGVAATSLGAGYLWGQSNERVHITGIQDELRAAFSGGAHTAEIWRAFASAALSNVSEKGGSAVAVAAFNALLRIARKQEKDTS